MHGPRCHRSVTTWEHLDPTISWHVFLSADCDVARARSLISDQSMSPWHAPALAAACTCLACTRTSDSAPLYAAALTSRCVL